MEVVVVGIVALLVVKVLVEAIVAAIVVDLRDSVCHFVAVVVVVVVVDIVVLQQMIATQLEVPPLTNSVWLSMLCPLLLPWSVCKTHLL